MALTAVLISLILIGVIGLLSAAIFGTMQRSKSADRVGDRYPPELQHYLDEQTKLLDGAPHWNVDASDDSRTLVIPIEMAMQSIVRQYGNGQYGDGQYGDNPQSPEKAERPSLPSREEESPRE